MKLKQEVSAVVVARDGAAWIAVENQICIFVGFGQSSIRKDAKLGDGTRRIFQHVSADDDLLQTESFVDGRGWMSNPLLGEFHTRCNRPDSELANRERRSQCDKKGRASTTKLENYAYLLLFLFLLEFVSSN